MNTIHTIRAKMIKENLKDMHELRRMRRVQKKWRDTWGPEGAKRFQGRIDFLYREIQVATKILDWRY